MKLKRKYQPHKIFKAKNKITIKKWKSNLIGKKLKNDEFKKIFNLKKYSI